MPAQLLGAFGAFQIGRRLGAQVAELKSARGCGFLDFAGLAERYRGGLPGLFKLRR